MILFLHNRYRTPGGEERAVEETMWLVREHIGEAAEVLERDSAVVGRGRAAVALLRGGLAPEDVAHAVRRTRARVVHAHNLLPGLGWRALAAARDAGAAVVLHLHQYRLVCAVGVCFTRGADCTRCHSRHTLPGIVHNCRGNRAEAVTYAAGLALWQRRLAEHVDAFIAPSQFAVSRLRELGAPVGTVHVVPHALRAFAGAPTARRDGYALVAARLAPEKGIEVAIEACRQSGIPLVVAGEGPAAERLARAATGAEIRFTGRVEADELARLRSEAALALVPSLFAETFGLSAAEAMAAGLPVVASRIGALPELVPEPWLASPGDAASLVSAMARVRSDAQAGSQAIARAREMCAPEAVAPRLAEVYDSVSAARRGLAAPG